MEETIAHLAMRDELLNRLSGAMSNVTELNGLCDFLADDFPYDVEHVVGLVLRNDELQPWQELMAAITTAFTPVRDEQIGPVRDSVAVLLAAMRS